LNAIDSPDPTIQAVAKQLQQRFNGFGTLTNEKLQFDFQGESHYVRVAPWRDEYGLDWLVVVSVPESAFMAQINANTRTTLLLCLAALAGATVLGFYTSRWITRPILRLSAATRAIAAGNLTSGSKPTVFKNSAVCPARLMKWQDNCATRLTPWRKATPS
jgi:methyl-accepting chemotaxis protein